MNRDQIIGLNLAIGFVCSYAFVWGFPLVYNIQQLIVYTYQSTPENAPILLAGAYGILFILMYGLVGFYCMSIAMCEIYNTSVEYIKERRDTL